MTDVPIRNVAEEDPRRIDEKAARLGLSRSEFLRRQIVATANRAQEQVTVVDLRLAGELTKDLADDTIMRDAWS